MARTLYLDIVCGVSGDMMLGALLDLGVPLEHLRTELARMPIPGLTIDAGRENRQGIAAVMVKLGWDKAVAYRTLSDIIGIVREANYGDRLEQQAGKVFSQLGQAEARVHRVPVEKVHFHEVGAVDTIVDVVGTCICLDYLKVSSLKFSTVVDGHGTVTCAHGVLPVPVPATVEMVRGLRCRSIDIDTELVTPTGAAIVTALGSQSLLRPEGKVVEAGYGCGTKTFDGHPNVLRAILIEDGISAVHDTVCVLESDMDHVSGEIMAFTAEELMTGGALDVSWSPIYMKKGRPGYRLTVLCCRQDRDRLIETVMVNTHTLGVRYRLTERQKAVREEHGARLIGSEVCVKQCEIAGRRFDKIEYDDLARIARARGVPLIDLTGSVPESP